MANQTANPWRKSLGALGSIFMTSDGIGEISKAAGMPRSALYFRGRVGVLGDLTVEAAHDVLAIFPRRVVEHVWSATSGVPAAATVAPYLEACHTWGRDNLASFGDVERLAHLLGTVSDRPDVGELPLASAWQREARADDPAAAAAQAAMVVREMRGYQHFAALALVNLPAGRASLVDDLAGAVKLKRTGWNDDEIAALQKTARPDDAERWEQAEAATDGAFLGLVGDTLPPEQVNELGDLLMRAHDHVRGS